MQWDDFQNIVSSAFGDLKDDPDLTDVTLVCEDGKQVEAHKVVLASTSPFFMDLLKRNRHPHPLIYMRGIKSDVLMAMVEFFYKGEANVFQENLDTFLALADEMRLKGLSRTDEQQETEGHPQIDRNLKRIFESPMLVQPTHKKETDKGKETKQQHSPKIFSETAVALNDSVEVGNLEMLDEQIRSMMEKGEKKISHNVKGNNQGYSRICKVCGEEGVMNVIKAHIEAKHITGITHTCDICGKSSKTKNSLVVHKSTYHRK